jgi:hypothetical protein
MSCWLEPGRRDHLLIKRAGDENFDGDIVRGLRRRNLDVDRSLCT